MKVYMKNNDEKDVNTIYSKKDFKKAVKSNEKEFVVAGTLANTLMPIVKLTSMSKAKKAMLIIFISTSGIGIIASLIASAIVGPVTMGTAPIIIGTAKMAVISSFAVSSGIETAIVVSCLSLCAIIGIGTVISILKGYKVEVHVGINKKDGIKLHFKAE